MIFKCNSCGEDRDFDTEFGLTVAEPRKDLMRYCKQCRAPKVYMPDVYWDGKEEHGLADDPNTGKPRVFTSRGQKAAYLKERGIMEAGDRIRGSYAGVAEQAPKRDSRPDVKRALAEVKKMGKEYKRERINMIRKMQNG